MLVTLQSRDGWAWIDSEPCFGVLSQLDEVTTDDDEWEDCPLENISSKDLACVIYSPDSGFSNGLNMSSDLTGDMEPSKFMDKFVKDVLQNPMSNGMFDHITFGQFLVPDNHCEETKDDLHKSKAWGFEINLDGKNMQKSLLPAMMVRNLMSDIYVGRVFKLLIDNNYDWHFAFMLSQLFYMNSCYDGNKYIHVMDHDSTILPDDFATLSDFKNMITGDFKQIYQGIWGDTEEGYGRDGYYDNKSAPQFKRTGDTHTLTDTFLDSKKVGEYLIPSSMSDSQTSIEDFLVFAENIYEEYKQWIIA